LSELLIAEELLMLIIDPIFKNMPRESAMKEMPIPDWLRARLRPGVTLRCEMLSGEMRWFIDDVEQFPTDC
jgi:hypothetical protein